MSFLKLDGITVGGKYRHYKDAYYVVLFVGQDSNNDRNEEPTVVYMALTAPHAGEVKIRRVQEFCEFVLWPDGKMAPRFVLVRD